MYDDLAQFKDWWINNRPFNTPEINALSHVSDTYGVVLYRQSPYQVELFNVKPNSVIPLHTHPDVDSFEVFVGGDIEFICDGIVKKQNLLGGSIRVLPSSWHGGTFGERGGCFISIQKWLNGIEPKFVGDNWADKNNSFSYKESKKELI
jgi:quercetin dioxygenase-like cupin family protein